MKRRTYVDLIGDPRRHVISYSTTKYEQESIRWWNEFPTWIQMVNVTIPHPASVYALRYAVLQNGQMPYMKIIARCTMSDRLPRSGTYNRATGIVHIFVWRDVHTRDKNTTRKIYQLAGNTTPYSINRLMGYRPVTKFWIYIIVRCCARASAYELHRIQYSIDI